MELPDYDGLAIFAFARRFGALAILAVVLAIRPASAASLAGVTMPETIMAGNDRLVLNGMGLRTYSMLAVHVYVAGLYLQRPEHDATQILDSSGPKLLRIRFVHAVAEQSVRRAWRTGLEKNCVGACKLPEPLLARFLASLHGVRDGDSVTFVFQQGGATGYRNGVELGSIDDPTFARLMLATFIGPYPAEAGLKRALLGQPTA